MNKKLGVLILIFIALVQFLVAEDFESEIDEDEKKIAEYMKKATPVKDFTYNLDFSNTGIVITKYTGKAPKVLIPYVIEELPVAEVGESAFRRGDYESYPVKSITFPDSVRNIRKLLL